MEPVFDLVPSDPNRCRISERGLRRAAEALDWMSWCKKQGTYTGNDTSLPIELEATRTALLKPLRVKNQTR